MPVVGLVQYLNFLTNLNAILYGHLVIDKHGTDWLEKFQFLWLLDHLVYTMDNLQPFPVELSFVLKIKFLNLVLQGVQLISVAAGHHYKVAFYK